MKILYASVEVAPFSKAGGLSDVIGSLPKSIQNEAEIAVFTPLHGCINLKKWNIKELENSSLWLGFGNIQYKFKLYMTQLPETNINVFFVQNDWYFSCFKDIYPKQLDSRFEHERYIAFSMATLEYAKLLNFRADIIQSNDWHTAMLPLYLKSKYKNDEFWEKTKNVFTIHNLAYQGTWSGDILDFANINKEDVYKSDCCEHYGKVNWMKGAINTADKIVVVSPRYADEILSEEYGEGMNYTLLQNKHKLVGILNGIDYSTFNPETDSALVKQYNINSINNKEENKKEILKHFGLNYNKNRPLIAMISRLVDQKGIDLIRNAENDLKKMKADFIFLGSGEKDYENLLIWLSNNTPNIRAYIDYRGDMVNLIYAGADFFLMPSKFEPCGLAQLIAMRYGTLPVVRATGGLDDTVIGYPLNDSTGFKFWEYSAKSMKEALLCALNIYKDKYTFDAMRRSAMQADFSWGKSAKKYIDIYTSLLQDNRQNAKNL